MQAARTVFQHQSLHYCDAPKLWFLLFIFFDYETAYLQQNTTLLKICPALFHRSRCSVPGQGPTLRQPPPGVPQVPGVRLPWCERQGGPSLHGLTQPLSSADTAVLSRWVVGQT